MSDQQCSLETIHPDGYKVGCEDPIGHSGEHIALRGEVDEYRWPTPPVLRVVPPEPRLDLDTIGAVERRLLADDPDFRQTLETAVGGSLRSALQAHGTLDASLSTVKRVVGQVLAVLRSDDVGPLVIDAVMRCSLAEYQARAEMAEAERDTARQQLNGYQEREAACCPEDVGFEEWIRVLLKQRDEARQQLKALIADLCALEQQWRNESPLTLVPASMGWQSAKLGCADHMSELLARHAGKE